MSLLAAEFLSIAWLLWNDENDPVFDGVGLAGFNSRANTFLLAKLIYLLFLSIQGSTSHHISARGTPPTKALLVLFQLLAYLS